MFKPYMSYTRLDKLIFLIYNARAAHRLTLTNKQTNGTRARQPAGWGEAGLRSTGLTLAMSWTGAFKLTNICLITLRNIILCLLLWNIQHAEQNLLPDPVQATSLTGHRKPEPGMAIFIFVLLLFVGHISRASCSFSCLTDSSWLHPQILLSYTGN